MSQTVQQQKSKRQMVFEALEQLGPDVSPERIAGWARRHYKEEIPQGTIYVYRNAYRAKVKVQAEKTQALPSVEDLKVTNKALGVMGYQQVPEGLIKFLEALSSNGSSIKVPDLVSSLRVLREIQN